MYSYSYAYAIPDDPRIARYDEETAAMLYGEVEYDEDGSYVDEYGVRHVNNGDSAFL